MLDQAAWVIFSKFQLHVLKVEQAYLTNVTFIDYASETQNVVEARAELMRNVEATGSTTQGQAIGAICLSTFGVPLASLGIPGYDSSAARLAESLGEVAVFEVDHPDTQAAKRAALSAGEWPANVRFVAVDFERDSLRTRLVEAGWDESAPTFWSSVPSEVVSRSSRSVRPLIPASSDCIVSGSLSR